MHLDYNALLCGRILSLPIDASPVIHREEAQGQRNRVNKLTKQRNEQKKANVENRIIKTVNLIMQTKGKVLLKPSTHTLTNI